MKLEDDPEYRKYNEKRNYAYEYCLTSREIPYRNKLLAAAKIPCEIYMLLLEMIEAPNALWFAQNFTKRMGWLSHMLPTGEYPDFVNKGFGTAKEAEVLGNINHLLGSFGKFSCRVARLVGLELNEAGTYLDWATGEWCGGRWMPHCLDQGLKDAVAELKPYHKKVWDTHKDLIPLYKEKVMYFAKKRDIIRDKILALRDMHGGDIRDSVKAELKDLYPKVPIK